MTRKELHKATGLSVSYIGRIVNATRTPSFPTAELLASATGTDPVLWIRGTKGKRAAALKAAK